MSSSEKQAAIIERFLGHCHRATPVMLDFIEVDEDVWSCPSKTEEVLGALTNEFSAEDLIESGIAVHGDDQAVTLAPPLTGGGLCLVLRDAVTGRPYELLTDAGCLWEGALPIFEVLRDARTQQLLSQGRRELIVAFDLEHVVMLRACGLPATQAAGLDQLPLEQVDRFCEVFELTGFGRDRLGPRRNPREQHNSDSECGPDDPVLRMMRSVINDHDLSARQTATGPASRLATAQETPVGAQFVFLGWTPLELSSASPPHLPAVVDHFRQLQRFMEVELDEIGLWEVEQETVERLRFIAERRSAAIFKQAMLDAAENIDVSIGQFGEEATLATGPPEDYATALSRFHESSLAEDGTGWFGPRQRNAAWGDVERLLRQQVIGPLRELALATNDPVERNLLMGFAELSHVFHMQSVVLGEQLNRRVADGEAEHSGKLPADQFKDLMTMTDRLIDMAKVTERCSQPKATIINARTTNSPGFRRLPHSD